MNIKVKMTAAQQYVEFDTTKENLNLICIGHVDSGKSTLSGRILKDSGEVKEADIKKFEIEAKEKKRDTWYLAFIMDINEEERQKGFHKLLI